MPAVLNNLDMNDQYGAVPKTSPTFALMDMLHDHLCPEMQAVTKMADLTKFRQTDVGQIGDFYANYVTRDILDMLANLAILPIFMQIMSPEISLTCWRIWRFCRFLCKLCHQRYP